MRPLNFARLSNRSLLHGAGKRLVRPQNKRSQRTKRFLKSSCALADKSTIQLAGHVRAPMILPATAPAADYGAPTVVQAVLPRNAISWMLRRSILQHFERVNFRNEF